MPGQTSLHHHCTPATRAHWHDWSTATSRWGQGTVQITTYSQPTGSRRVEHEGDGVEQTMARMETFPCAGPGWAWR